MSASPRPEPKLFGLFELDPAGTVLYSRVETEERTAGASPDVSGRNFYAEVARFENVEEFRRRVARFTRGASPADNFNFNCLYDGGVWPVKVLLARIRERTSGEHTKSVLVHIRRGTQLSESES